MRLKVLYYRFAFIPKRCHTQTLQGWLFDMLFFGLHHLCFKLTLLLGEVCFHLCSDLLQVMLTSAKMEAGWSLLFLLLLLLVVKWLGVFSSLKLPPFWQQAAAKAIIILKQNTLYPSETELFIWVTNRLCFSLSLCFSNTMKLDKWSTASAYEKLWQVHSLFLVSIFFCIYGILEKQSLFL